MFDQDSQDQQQSQNDQSSFAPPGMAPIVDHSLPMPTPDPVTAATTAPAVDTPTPAGADLAHDSSPTIGAAADDDLLNIKQQALQHLSPLVVHLDQTPEEKFRTTMMMIQASDDPSLIKVAYEAAQQIGDEKARAQALLDVVNEINYFTQQQKS